MANDGHCTTCTQKASFQFTMEMASAGRRFRVSRYVCLRAPSRSNVSVWWVFVGCGRHCLVQSSPALFQFGCSSQFRLMTVSGYWAFLQKCLLCCVPHSFASGMHVGEPGQTLRNFFSQKGGSTTLRLFGFGGCDSKTEVRQTSLQRKRFP